MLPNPNLQSIIKKIKSDNADILQTFLTSKPFSVSKNSLFNIDFKEIKNLLKKNNLKLVIHSNYLLNFCSYPPSSKRITWALDYYLNEMKKAHKLGALGTILHIGAKKDLTNKDAYYNFVQNIKYIIKNKPKNIKIIFELTAGGGTKIAFKLNDFKKLWDMFSNEDKKHIKICLDTAHIFLSGYPIHTNSGLDKYLKDFEKLIGFKHVLLFHLNDAKFELGSHRDVHTNIGKGYLFNNKLGGSIDSLHKIVLFAKKHKIHLILETGGDCKKELSLIRNIITQNGGMKISKIDKVIKKKKKVIKKKVIKKKDKVIYKKDKVINKKEKIIEIFKELSEIYKVLNDEFRHKAYRKAILNLKKYDGNIELIKDVKNNKLKMNKIEGIGKSMELKIIEILKTNKLKLLDELKNNTKNTKNLQRVMGIGPVEANKLIKKGISSIQNLKTHIELLDNKQKLGLKYLSNLERKINSSTMEKYQKYIQNLLNKKYEKGINVKLVGSYLTGKAQQEGAHDIDLLITIPSIQKRKDIKNSIEKIKEILDEIILDIFSQGKNRMSFLAKLKDDKFVRHIDILLTPIESYYPALLYFGSGVDESRRLRQIAKDKGYKLNEYELLHIQSGRKIYLKGEIDKIIR